MCSMNSKGSMGSTPLLRILAVHNRYQVRAGEDAIFDAETDLLESHGHHVTRLVFDNRSIPEHPSMRDRAALAMATVWSTDSASRVSAALRSSHADVVHFHNTFPLISPSAYVAAKRHHVAVVQTLNNFRLVCAAYSLFRDGGICEDCLAHKFAWPALQHRCYRNSVAATAPVVALQSFHRLRHTWERNVDLYIAGLHEGAIEKFGSIIPRNKLVLKPNFVAPDPGFGDGEGEFALFAGRLVIEKGVETLLDAWDGEDIPFPLKIAGDGPLAGRVSEFASRRSNVEWLGAVPPDSLLELMANASFLIFPSLWYEGQPRTIIESFATGTPVIASNIGAMREMVHHQRTGTLFEPGSSAQLAATVGWMLAERRNWRRMREQARRRYEECFTEQRNYEMLMDIYRRAMSLNGERSFQT